MPKAPEYGVPDAENPEWTERDFALARRRDGSLVNPVAASRQHLLDAIADLDGARKDADVEKALRSMREALASLTVAAE